MHRLGILIVLLSSISALAQEVRLYTSIDQPIAKKVIDQFEHDTGIRVIMTTDAEATKTTGLVERLRAEKNNPHCDIWWNNEIFHTIRLAEEGLLEPYDSPIAKDIPPRFRDTQNRWTASGYRLRVLLADTRAGEITGYQDLLQPRLKGRIGLCKPAFGTAGGHVAALYLALGEEKYLAYLRNLRANGIRLLGGNSVVADYLINGELLAGFTDNDDAQGAVKSRPALKMIIPDQQKDGLGTLVVPCTVALVHGGKNQAAARKLMDYLLRPESENILIQEGYAYASVRSTDKQVREMSTDFAAIAHAMPKAVNLAIRELE